MFVADIGLEQVLFTNVHTDGIIVRSVRHRPEERYGHGHSPGMDYRNLALVINAKESMGC